MTPEYWTIIKSVLAAFFTAVGATKIITIRFEKKIQSKYDAQIAELESKLKKEEFRHSVVFAMTEKTIAETYKQLLELWDSTYGLVNSSIETRMERGKAFYTRSNAFLAYYRPLEIYIPPQSAKMIKEVFAKLNDAQSKWDTAMAVSSRPSFDFRHTKCPSASHTKRGQ